MPVVEFRIHDIVRLRKPHPCGGFEWEVYRLGADIGLRCRTCGHHVMLARPVLEKRLKKFISRGEEIPLALFFPTVDMPTDAGKNRDQATEEAADSVLSEPDLPGGEGSGGVDEAGRMPALPGSAPASLADQRVARASADEGGMMPARSGRGGRGEGSSVDGSGTPAGAARDPEPGDSETAERTA